MLLPRFAIICASILSLGWSTLSLGQENKADSKFVVVSRTLEVDDQKVEMLTGEYDVADEAEVMKRLGATIAADVAKNPKMGVQIGQMDVEEPGRGLAQQQQYDKAALDKLRDELNGRAVVPEIDMQMGVSSKNISAFYQRLQADYKKFVSNKTKRFWFYARVGTITSLSVGFMMLSGHLAPIAYATNIIALLTGCSLTAKFSPQLNRFQNRGRIWNIMKGWRELFKVGLDDAKRTGRSNPFARADRVHGYFNFGLMEVTFGLIIVGIKYGLNYLFGYTGSHFDWLAFAISSGAATLSQGVKEEAIGRIEDALRELGVSEERIDRVIREESTYGSIMSVVGFNTIETGLAAKTPLLWTAGGMVLSVLSMTGIKQLKKWKQIYIDAHAQKVVERVMAEEAIRKMPCETLVKSTTGVWPLDASAPKPKTDMLEEVTEDVTMAEAVEPTYSAPKPQGNQVSSNPIPVWYGEKVVSYEALKARKAAEKAAQQSQQPASAETPLEKPKFRVNAQTGKREPLNEAARRLLENENKTGASLWDSLLNAAAAHRAA